ncbi:MAG: serine hydrolase family protein [Moraxellaceae bacterium]|nr:MAG: serine hydrolase family protein [Moraxellaceae bacterium]
MAINLLFIHSAGAQSGQQGSSPFLKHLRNDLGSDFVIKSPKMPVPTKPSYERWREELDQQFGGDSPPKIVVGHSLGGSVLLKYLSEQTSVSQMVGVFIIAAPWWGAKDWMVEEFMLDKNIAQTLPKHLAIYFYHARNDDVASIQHLTLYANAIPKASVTELKAGGHLFKTGLPELVQDIKALSHSLIHS